MSQVCVKHAVCYQQDWNGATSKLERRSSKLETRSSKLERACTVRRAPQARLRLVMHGRQVGRAHRSPAVAVGAVHVAGERAFAQAHGFAQRDEP